MTEQLSDFTWWVAEGGYHWVDEEPGEGDARVCPKQAILKTVLPYASLSDSRSRRYEPLEEPTALFRTFADIDPTPDKILEFANRYGHLTRTEAIYPGYC